MVPESPRLLQHQQVGRVAAFAHPGDDGVDVDGDAFPPRVGVGVGDRVAGYIPNCPEAIIAMAATAALGEFTFFFVIRIIILIITTTIIIITLRSCLEFNLAGLWRLRRARQILTD